MATTYVKKLAVLGLSYRATGGAPPALGVSQASLEWLWGSTEGPSISGYFHECTGGMLRIEPTVFGYYDIEDTAQLNAMSATMSGQRAQQVDLALKVAAEKGIDLSGFDGLVIEVAGATGIDSGGRGLTVNGQRLRVALFDQQDPHDFMAHETGHALGLDHPFRQSYTAYPRGEYGDPTCVMSAMTYGGHRLRRRVPVDPASGIAASSDYWTASGPGLAMSTLWRYCGDFPDAPAWVRLLPQSPGLTEVMLTAPSVAGLGTRLVVVPTGATAPSPTFYTMEYRPRVSWDAFLSGTPGEDDIETCPGVVIHRIVDIPGAAGYSGPQAVDYVTTIPVPSAGDSDWSNSTLGVRVREHSELNATIEVDGALPGASWAELEVSVHTGREATSPGPAVDVTMMGADCGRRSYQTSVVDRWATVRLLGTTFGLDDATFRWSVNGVEIPDTSTAGAPLTSGEVTVRLHYAAGYEQSTPVVEDHSFSYRLQGNVLEVDPPAGLGRMTLVFALTATSGARSNTAAERVEVQTRSYRLPPGAGVDRASCTRPVKDALEDATLMPGAFHIDEGVNWLDLDKQERVKTLLALTALTREQPWRAGSVLAGAAGQLGVTAQDLTETIASIQAAGGRAPSQAEDPDIA